MSKNHKFTTVNASPESPTYKEEMQKKSPSFEVDKAQKPTPMKATPVTKRDPGLGATTLSHPYKAGKPKI